MKTITNCSLFIVPNSLVSKANYIGSHFMSDTEWFNKDLTIRLHEPRLKVWGIKLDVSDRLVQVWIHCKEEDNLTDHGLHEEMVRELWPEAGKSADVDSVVDHDFAEYAPTFLPIRLFHGKKEGDTITLTTSEGIDLEIKLEQLPYRYGHRGPFEKCLRTLICQDEEYARIKKFELARLQTAGLKGWYTGADKYLAKLTREFTIRVEQKSYGTFVYDAIANDVIANIEDGFVFPRISTMLRKPDTLSKFVAAMNA